MKFVEIKKGMFVNPQKIVGILCYNPTSGREDLGEIAVKMDNDDVFTITEVAGSKLSFNAAKARTDRLLEQIKEA